MPQDSPSGEPRPIARPPWLGLQHHNNDADAADNGQVADEPVTGPPGGYDEIEARAAALHEQMAARRAPQGRPEPFDPFTEATSTPGAELLPPGAAPADPIPTGPPTSAGPPTGPAAGEDTDPRRPAPPPWQAGHQPSPGSAVAPFTDDRAPGRRPDHRASGPDAPGVDAAAPHRDWFDAPAPIDNPHPPPPPPHPAPPLPPRVPFTPGGTPAPPPAAGFSAPPWAHGPPPPPPPGWLPPPPPGWQPPSDTRPPPPRNQHHAPAFGAPPSLDDAEIVRREHNAPQTGWRKAVHRASGGRINPGESRREREKGDLLEQIRQPIVGDFRIAVLSIKGGVGKTTTTLGLGSALALVRTDRIIAVDANPDRGTLAERVRDTSTQSTVRDLLNDPAINRYADVRGHTRMASSRLEVLASEQDPAVSEVFGEADYRRTVDILRHYYNIILTDCGTGIMHSAMTGVLDLAHAIVLVSSPAMDAARSASATLDWLQQHGHSALVREAHVVLSASRPGSASLKLDKVSEHFAARCRSVHLIPFDPHLAEGADVDFDLLKPGTFQAYLELAAAVAEKFPRLRGAGPRQ